MFEHGPARGNSSAGCGVDQAHLHSIALSFDLLQDVRSATAGDLDWFETDPDDPWATIETDRDYYIVSAGSVALGTYPRAEVSQYFRRRIAGGLGRQAEWDYRSFPNYPNIKRTVQEFKQAMSSDVRTQATGTET